MARCAHCQALLTPGAPFCLTCFTPLEPDPPAPAPLEPAPEAAPEPAPAAVGAPAVTAGADGGFFAPPPARFASHPGEQGDWRRTAPAAALLAPAPRRAPSRTPLIAAGVAGVLLLAGAVAGLRAVVSGPSEEQAIATAFREARPPGFFPALPDVSSFGLPGDEPEQPGAATAYVTAADPAVRAANDGLLSMQRTLAGWAAGDVSDDAVRTAVADLERLLTRAVPEEALSDAPPSTQRGFAKLRESATEYRLALSALLDWLDSRGDGSRITYRLSVGSANVHWDEGIASLYRAARLPAPDLPHPPPKD